MDHRKRRAVFAVDGYEISATFADSRNTAVLGHVKQILLSSFVNNLTDKTPGDNLALKAKKMIVNCLIKRVDVYRDYKLHIDFNIDFEQFSMGLDIVWIAA